MRRGSSISKATSYRDIGDYWDTHDLGEVWDQTRPVDFEVDIRAERVYCAVDRALADGVRTEAARRGVSLATLINLWIQEKLRTPGV